MPLDIPDPEDQPIAARADQLRAEAEALWAAECNRRLRELGTQNPDEAGYRVAAELDGLRRTLRADLCDRLLA